MTDPNLEDVRLRASSQAVYSFSTAIAAAIAGVFCVMAVKDTIGLQNVLLIALISAFAVVASLFVGLRQLREGRALERIPEERDALAKLADDLLAAQTPTKQSTVQSVGTSLPVKG